MDFDSYLINFRKVYVSNDFLSDISVLFSIFSSFFYILVFFREQIR